MKNIAKAMLLLAVCQLLSCGPSKKTGTAPSTAEIPSWDDDQKEEEHSIKIPESNANTPDRLLQEKYSVYLKVPPETVKNIRLYRFVDSWLHTPYKWGGTGRNGIDCSAFIQRLLAEVYNIHIPRTSAEQFLQDYIDRFGSTEHLAEGDLVFFQTMQGKLVSHVGMYLTNDRFVNSSSKGVSIALLTDPYWKRKYLAAGRIKLAYLRTLEKQGR